MGVVQACLQGEATIRRARSLFADAEPTSATAEAAQLLTDAADTTAAAGRRTSGLSGEGIDAHLTLGVHLDAAAAITTAGADQLDAIAQQARATTQAAATATTPAAQRAVLAAMKTHVQAANNVVETTRRQAADLAAGIKGIDYKQGPPGAGHDEFDLDTQYARLAALPGGPMPAYVDPNVTATITPTLTATIAWTCNASLSCPSRMCP